MKTTATQTRAVVIEREMPHPPERVWRALTQPQLVEEWLMPGNFKLEPGHRFQFHGSWGAVDCEIRTIEPHRTLSYTWGDHDLNTLVTWTLTPTNFGTRLRMEQTGFRPNQPRYYGGAKAGWPKFIAKLEQVLEQQ